MPFPLALPALSSLTGGGGLSSAPVSGLATSSLGNVHIGGLDFGPSATDQLSSVAIGAAVALGIVLLTRRRR